MLCVRTSHRIRTVATVASTGEVLAGSDSERKVWVFDGDELKDTIDVARETDQLEAVQVDGQRDSVVRTNLELVESVLR